MLYYVFSSANIIVVIVYLGSLWRLANYLRHAHPDVWIALGRPAIPDQAENARNPFPFAESVFRTMVFIFSDRHKELGDRQLSYLIWLVRILLGAGTVLFAAAISLKS